MNWYIANSDFIERRTLPGPGVSIAAATLFVAGNALAADGQISLAAVEYRDGHREAAIVRRAELMERMEGGLAVITSADRSQPNRYEFYVDDTEHKDFVFLTGIYDAQPPGHVLVLNPGGDTYREVLYTDMDPAKRAACPASITCFRGADSWST